MSGSPQLAGSPKANSSPCRRGRPNWPGRCAGVGRRKNPVGAHPHQHDDRQVGQNMRQAGTVVAGVGHQQDLRVTGLPMPSVDEAVPHTTHLGRGHAGGVVAGREPDRVQRRGPGTAPGLQRDDNRVGPPRHHRVLVFATPVGVTQDPLRTGMRLRPQPTSDVHRQHQPPVGGPRQRHRAQRDPQPLDVDPTACQGGIPAAVPSAMLTNQGHSAIDRTRPSAHNTASTNSNNASVRRGRHWWNSRRNHDRSPGAPAGPKSCTLIN